MANIHPLQTVIEQGWAQRDQANLTTNDGLRDAVTQVLQELDQGTLRVAVREGARDNAQWITQQWLKQAILLSFRLNPSQAVIGGNGFSLGYDKVPLKFANWREADFAKAGFRAVPGAIVRHSAYIAPGAILMPSFVNVGARVGAGTMIDTWATVGSCAQIGDNCHISGGTGIGGVLEPLQANPTIVEDGCFIGARSEIAEGVVVETGAVISMGVFIGASTKIIDRQTGEIIYGRVPPYSVVVPGSLPSPNGGPALSCAVIVKRVDEKTRSKTSINELLRSD